MRTTLSSYYGMIARCKEHQRKGRNINVYTQWLKNFGAYDTWAKSNGWSEDKETHRIDSLKDYEPGNIEFVTKEEHKERHTKQNRYGYKTPKCAGSFIYNPQAIVDLMKEHNWGYSDMGRMLETSRQRVMAWAKTGKQPQAEILM